MEELREYLQEQITRDSNRYFGFNDQDLILPVVNAWLNDVKNSVHRFEDIYLFFSEVDVREGRILDLASGCGTFVFHGLLNGVNVWGVEPEDWKNTLNHKKVDAYGYPEAWKEHFIKAVGENLPFRDGAFKFISSYQTLEHVQDVEACLAEMIRVATVGVFLRAPDYSGTFEGHYRLPWIPFFPRQLARIYLRLLGRPTLGLDTIQYISTNSIKAILHQHPVTVYDQKSASMSAQIVADKFNLHRWGVLGWLLSRIGAYVWRIMGRIQKLFRQEENMNLVILIR